MYTFKTNKAGKEKKDSLVGSIKGTPAIEIVSVLEKFSEPKLLQVKKLSLSIARNMESALKTSVTKYNLVKDQFHVVKPAMEALKHVNNKPLSKILNM